MLLLIAEHSLKAVSKSSIIRLSRCLKLDQIHTCNGILSSPQSSKLISGKATAVAVYDAATAESVLVPDGVLAGVETAICPGIQGIGSGFLGWSGGGAGHEEAGGSEDGCQG